MIFRRTFYVWGGRFKLSFFPSSVNIWNSLGTDNRNSDSLGMFKNGFVVFLKCLLLITCNIILL